MRLSQGPLAAVLSLSLVAQSVPGVATTATAAAVRSTAETQNDARILHALNRFTFGPRPGDLEAVRAMGLERWFNQQLHAAAIENSALATRLAEYPAMRRSPQDLLYRLPSNAVIRQVIDGKAPMPENGALAAVYENQVARVRAKREEKGQKPANGADSANSPAPSMQMIRQAAQPLPSSAERLQEPPPQAVSRAPDLSAALLALPPRERVERLTRMNQPDFDAFLRSLKGPQRVALTADMSPDLKETVGALENPERLVAEELMSQRLTRDIYSNAQLQEVMTDFWLNHFNVYLRKNEATPYYLVSYERDVIRPRALGKFKDLLEATAQSPAMLIYLDNAESIGPDSLAAQRAKIAAARNPDRRKKAPEGLNENYARELMELHTLGVSGGYTQADVIQAARILTGWTVDRPQRGGAFQFNENRHEPGTKKVMGKKFKDQGEREGRELLHFLATRPATAQFISRKLAVRFVSDDPPRPLVDRMAKAYLSSAGDIATVLKTMFHSPEFWQPQVYRAKVKTPLEYVVSAARASNIDVTNYRPLIGALREMGMPLYGCIPPTGYKWDAADWVSTGALVARMNFALSLASNRLNGVTAAWSPDRATAPQSTDAMTDGSAPPTPESEEARLEAMLVPTGLSASTRTAVLDQFQQQSAGALPVSMTGSAARRNAALPPVEKEDQLLAGLLLGSPEFQRR